MPASTPWWSTPSIAAPRPGRRPTLGLAAAIVASVLAGVAMADPPPARSTSQAPPAVSTASTANPAWRWINIAQPSPALTSSLPYAVYPVPYGIDRGTCDRRLLVEEFLRGTTGLASSKSKARPVTISGITAAPLVGNGIGRSMDEVDQYCVSRVLEYAPDRAHIHWYGEPGIGYGVTPLSTFERDGRYCREFHTAAQIDGRNERVYGTACRLPNGVWQVMS